MQVEISLFSPVMPKVLWLLEHVRLWVDPLKDAPSSPFGKAERLHLSLSVSQGVLGTVSNMLVSAMIWYFKMTPAV